MSAGEHAPVGIRDFGDWCRASKIDEWKALIKVADGSHEAAYLLHYLLQWSGGEAVAAAEGWVYRTADEIAEDTGLKRHGLDRAVGVLIRTVDLETTNRRVKLPSGDCLVKKIKHYRLDRAALAAAFTAATGRPVLSAADLPHADKSHLPDADKSHLPPADIPRLPDAANPQLPPSDIPRPPHAGIPHLPDAVDRDSSYVWTLKTFEKASKDTGKESLTPPERETAALHLYLQPFVERLGQPLGFAPMLEDEIARLGDREARDVLLGCGKAGSWKYLLTSLESRATPYRPAPPPVSAPPPAPMRPLHVLGTFEGIWLTLCSGTGTNPAARHALGFGATITETDTALHIAAGAYPADLTADPDVQQLVATMQEVAPVAVVITQASDETPTASPDEAEQGAA